VSFCFLHSSVCCRSTLSMLSMGVWIHIWKNCICILNCNMAECFPALDRIYIIHSIINGNMQHTVGSDSHIKKTVAWAAADRISQAWSNHLYGVFSHADNHVNVYSHCTQDVFTILSITVYCQTVFTEEQDFMQDRICASCAFLVDTCMLYHVHASQLKCVLWYLT